jgi:hypothetical protein
MYVRDSRIHLTSQEAMKAMMGAFIVGCWDQRDRCVCMHVRVDACGYTVLNVCDEYAAYRMFP